MALYPHTVMYWEPRIGYTHDSIVYELVAAGFGRSAPALAVPPLNPIAFDGNVRMGPASPYCRLPM